MYLFPNGQNIQFVPQTSPTAPTTQDFDMQKKIEELLNPPRPAPPPVQVLQALKDIAPHMNRKARRAQLKQLKTRAKSETAELAKREIAKQKKENDRDG